jgi:hypothetical protein
MRGLKVAQTTTSQEGFEEKSFSLQIKDLALILYFKPHRAKLPYSA